MHIAVEKGNVKIVKLLLANEDLNVNSESIFNSKNFIQFESQFFLISFQLTSFLITFLFHYFNDILIFSILMSF